MSVSFTEIPIKAIKVMPSSYSRELKYVRVGLIFYQYSVEVVLLVVRKNLNCPPLSQNFKYISAFYVICIPISQFFSSLQCGFKFIDRLPKQCAEYIGIRKPASIIGARKSYSNHHIKPKNNSVASFTQTILLAYKLYMSVMLL